MHAQMYYGRVQELSQQVLKFIRRHQLVQAGDRVGVAVSGGADSVALLRLLLELRGELGIVLSVVHFNHQLRGAESDGDEQFVRELAQKHGLECHCESGEVKARASEKHLSLEASARMMRYEYFKCLLHQGALNRIATAHTLDDQAETVLMRVIRGAGTRGLAGIYPQLSVSHQSSVVSRQQGPTANGSSIIRPLLGTRRKDLEAYLSSFGQGWREDSSNRDLRHTRNRVRHGILPRLERHLNPAVREALAEAAEIARVEEDYWDVEMARVLPQVCGGAARRRPDIRRDTGATVNLAALVKQPLALQRRVVRAVGSSLGLHLEFRHVEEILQLGSECLGGAKSAVLPDGWVASRYKHELCFEPARRDDNTDYEYRLTVPGEVDVPETGSRFEAIVVPAGAAGYNPEHLFDAGLLASSLLVRNWRAGDRFWPAHSKAPKKIKELLQERHVSGAERKSWPVVVSGEEVVWLRGFAAPAQFRPKDGARLVAIRETTVKV
jgi:tRNA(Ile)-lysidine synthase